MNKIGAFLLDTVETIVTSLAIFLVIYLFLARLHYIEGPSMRPNFENGNYLLVNLVSYRFHQPQRGDVIVFIAPPSPNHEFIKRIIGIPGDKIQITQNRIYLNGKLEADSFLPTSFTTIGGNFLPEEKEITIPEGQYFVLGDNRSQSSDSRDWGLVPRKNIIGKAWLRVWPPQAIGFTPAIRF